MDISKTSFITFIWTTDNLYYFLHTVIISYLVQKDS